METKIDMVLDSLRTQFQPGTEFTAKEIAGFPDTKLHDMQNYLWRLSKKGYLDKPRGVGSKGKYILRGRRTSTPKQREKAKAQPEAVSPTQAIYDLLEFMAKAEAPLRRAAKILEAVDSA